MPPPEAFPLARHVTAFAALIALVLAIAPPLIHGLAAMRLAESELGAEARAIAGIVTAFVNRNPELWTFEESRLASFLELQQDHHPREQRTLRDSAGAVIVRAGPAPRGGAVLRAIEPVRDFGRIAGSVEVTCPLWPVLADTAWLAAGAMLLALLAFLALRSVPLRLLDSAFRRMTHLATHDQLTGLPNRFLCQDRLAQAVMALRRPEDGMHPGLAVLCLDLDRFKEVNDTLGHPAGDAVLRATAERLRACLREGDTLARLGGDEFAIIQHDAGQPHAAAALAQRLIEAMEAPFTLEGRPFTIGTSIGIALATGGPGETPELLLRSADTALYAAKNDGRGSFRFFAEAMNLALRERRTLEADLRAALARGEFSLLYQPQVSFPDRRVVGVEALIRWDHPERGRVTPDRFIPLAEELGLLPQIGAWVLRQACTDARHWPGLRVAVNVSPHQIHAGGFERLVAGALDATGLPAGRLEIEITEGVLLAETERTLATLDALRQLGVTVAMDDFGTGYSSIGYLRRFPFDKIKIDRSFVSRMAEDPASAALVRAVLGMTEALGAIAAAEGVETSEQARLLAAEGCAEAQGWLFGKPLPPAAITAMLETAPA